MNKTQIIQAQGKAVMTSRSTTVTSAALVLDTTSLWRERRTWGKPVRFLKSTQTACKQDRLGVVEHGWLVLHVSALSYSPDIRERIAAADAFIRNFTGTIEDVLNPDNTINRDVVPSDVTVSLVNNRNLHARPVEAAPEPVAEVTPEPVVEAAPVKRGKAQQRVLDFLSAQPGRTMVVSLIVKELADQGIKTWFRATNDALAKLAADPTSGIVEVTGGNKAYRYEG